MKVILKKYDNYISQIFLEFTYENLNLKKKKVNIEKELRLK